MYFGGFRLAEAVGLVETDLILPEQGWGSALLHRARPSVGKQWIDSGETHDDRGLKNRPIEDVRRVPVPPHLVAVLREHLTPDRLWHGRRRAALLQREGLGRPVLDLLPRLAGSQAPGASAGRRSLTAHEPPV